MTGTLSRRSLAGAAALLLPASTSAVALPAPGGDAVLLARVDDFLAGLREERTFLAGLSDADRTTAHAYRLALARKGKLTRFDRQALAIAKLPARTLEGLRAKARAAAWNAGGDDTALPRLLISDDLLGSLLADLTGIARCAKGARA